MLHSVQNFTRQQQTNISVERAIAELRAGRPVAITGDRKAILVASLETLDLCYFSTVQALGTTPLHLILTQQRLEYLRQKAVSGGVVRFSYFDLAKMQNVAFGAEVTLDLPIEPLRPLEKSALELAHQALVLPGLICADVQLSAIDRNCLRVSSKAISELQAANLEHLHIVSRAAVPLDGALDSEFVVFRGGEGLRDHVAVIIGKPDTSQAVAVRLHSACLTGDVFGSLKCDCGDQLRFTAAQMAQNGGGIILYLDQEGRGNGLGSKIRAYGLQAQGIDTYDADFILGLGPDQRHFDFAAAMLQQLGIKKVQLFTNNPAKIAALQQAGIEVSEETRIFGRPTKENLSYLATKRDRAGHKFAAHLPQPNDE